MQGLQAEHADKMQPISHVQLGGPEKLTGAEENGGLADVWHIDDGDILCHPILVVLPS